MENEHAEIERGNGVELSDFNGWAALHPVGVNKGAVGLMDKGAAFVVYKADATSRYNEAVTKREWGRRHRDTRRVYVYRAIRGMTKMLLDGAQT